MQHSFERISAIWLRYFYLLRSSVTRMIELFFWPTFEVVIWGYTSIYVAQNMSFAGNAISMLLGAAMLWNFLIRAQFGVSISFTEEFYSRNLGHLFISPIRTWELVTALSGWAAFRAFLAILPAILLAAVCFHFNLFSLGLPLAGFMVCLFAMGLWIGFFAMAILIQFGIGTETLIWMLAFLLAPVSAVFYPVAVLPPWLQVIAHLTPASHVFEGMRAIITHQNFDGAELWWAAGLNVVFMGISIVCLMLSLRDARQRGALLVVGE